MDFRLLGPVEAWHDGERRPGAGRPAKVRCLLAVLLYARFGGQRGCAHRTGLGRPATGREVRYKYVGWPRGALAPYGIDLVSRDDGYLLDVEPTQVDLHRFRRLVAWPRLALVRPPTRRRPRHPDPGAGVVARTRADRAVR